jgi:hypothetical protein
MSLPLEVSALFKAHSTAITWSVDGSSTGCSSTSDSTLHTAHSAAGQAQLVCVLVLCYVTFACTLALCAMGHARHVCALMSSIAPVLLAGGYASSPLSVVVGPWPRAAASTV